MKYEYTVVADETETGGNVLKRPIVDVEISNGKHKRTFVALIDSGADRIHMPSYIASILGIDREKCPRVTSMGISMEGTAGFLSELTFRIHGQTAPFTAPVVFIDTDIPVLLGREGFFDKYRIRFEQDHDIFEITPSRNN